METCQTIKQTQLLRASLYFLQLWTFFFQLPHLWVILLSWSPLIKCLLFIHKQNCCFDVWQSLIFASVLLYNPFVSWFSWTLYYAAKTTINSRITHYVGEIQRALSFALCGVSVFTSIAIRVDRFLALRMGVRYRQVVRLRRFRTAVTYFWLIGISVGLWGWFWSVRNAYITAVIFAALSVVISVFFYVKIYLRLQQHQTQVEHVHQGQFNRRGNSFIITQYKKTVYSIAWMQLAMVVYYD